MSNRYTTEAAAQYLGLSKARIRQLIKDGRLPAEKQGRDHILYENDLKNFEAFGRKKPGRPSREKSFAEAVQEDQGEDGEYHTNVTLAGNGRIHLGDSVEVLSGFEENKFQLVVADPPYFQVLLGHEWDNSWESPEKYLEWTLNWLRACKRVLRPDGLLYVFGQLGKREHVWLHVCAALSKEMQFHDMLIWDRVVGYNERYDSFTPQYEMVLVLRKSADVTPYFNKDAVRLPYDEETIRLYMKDKRYQNREAREAHLRKGKYATNILHIPSLKGASKEKIGHPSQKPLALIEQLVSSSSREGDMVLDPFLGSGTTAVVCEKLGRKWVGVESNESFVEMSRKRIMALKPDLEFTFA
jgi:excisionase family DNA binding protein